MKYFLTLLLFVFFATTLSGQAIRIAAGPSFSWINWHNSLPNETGNFSEMITGFNFLAGYESVDFGPANMVYSLGFMQKGGKDSFKVDDPESANENWVDYSFRSNYLTVSAIGKINFPIEEVITPYVSFGPRLDMLLTYNENMKLMELFQDTGELNRFLVGLNAGAGIEFTIDKILAGVSFDYYFNLNKLVNYTTDYGVESKINEDAFSVNLTLGYSFE
jgi:hypothetical protein